MALNGEEKRTPLIDVRSGAKMGNEGKVTKRKPRAGKLQKVTMRIIKTCLPYAKYTLIPGLFLTSLYFTEPRPTLWELLDPFSQ